MKILIRFFLIIGIIPFHLFLGLYICTIGGLECMFTGGFYSTDKITDFRKWMVKKSGL